GAGDHRGGLADRPDSAPDATTQSRSEPSDSLFGASSCGAPKWRRAWRGGERVAARRRHPHHAAELRLGLSGWHLVDRSLSVGKIAWQLRLVLREIARDDGHVELPEDRFFRFAVEQEPE